MFIVSFNWLAEFSPFPQYFLFLGKTDLVNGVTINFSPANGLNF